MTRVIARAAVYQQIQGALRTDAKRLRELTEDLGKLEEPYHRYLGLREERAKHEKSAQGLIALLGANADIGEAIDMYPSAAVLRQKAALWEHVSNYLRFVSEASMNEILAVLKWAGIEATRQGIESAVRTHPKWFGVRKHGGEKFIFRKQERPGLEGTSQTK